MNFEMQIANMLAKNINGFIKFVNKHYENKNNIFCLHTDKVYQLKLLVEEYKFQVLADELLRINRFTWDENYTYLLVDRFRKGMSIIEEYVENNYNDLFIFTARLYTLNSLSLTFSKEE
ncbi:hypothetical protein NGI46_09945 [Peribacillus butanolivorans]|uniref:hypothetical protein n=1 Tax=Peribacillus butanolivorans TaxID=421767 RepID=UPI00207CD959|nr:hypothetical protein [Peribacillus butanolivorans]MCO0597789.1 hypothetical protein [Peribacillus butanolivorans]